MSRFNSDGYLEISLEEVATFKRDSLIEKMNDAIALFDSMAKKHDSAGPLDGARYRDELANLREMCISTNCSSSGSLAEICQRLVALEATTDLLRDRAETIHIVLDMALELLPRDVVHHFQDIQYRDPGED